MSDMSWIRRILVRDAVNRSNQEYEAAHPKRPCPSTALSVLGMVGEPARVRCGLLEGHAGLHRMEIRWAEPEGSEG